MERSAKSLGRSKVNQRIPNTLRASRRSRDQPAAARSLAQRTRVLRRGATSEADETGALAGRLLLGRVRLVSPAPAHQIANRCHSKIRGFSRTEELSGRRQQAESCRVSVHS
jgi:hypothetical protein